MRSGADLLILNLKHSYKDLSEPVLDIPHLAVKSGSQVAITGPSGSGKSTFVNLVTGLIAAQQGKVCWGDDNLGHFSESRRDRWRGQKIGLVMQDFHLFAGLSALENILLPARLAGKATPELIARAHMLLKRVGITRARQSISTMSRGEMQRVSVARAMLRNPAAIIADEPTASLDEANGKIVTDLLIELARENHSTLIVITHDMTLANRLEKRMSLKAGLLHTDEGMRTI
ncbi:ATP-binding cassette domain-containing protein [Paraburkholderia aspalathi]|nr:ATP-binding cassette domain-containing protein [Paraburkholderia aspalathi]